MLHLPLASRFLGYLDSCQLGEAYRTERQDPSLFSLSFIYCAAVHFFSDHVHGFKEAFHGMMCPTSGHLETREGILYEKNWWCLWIPCTGRSLRERGHKGCKIGCVCAYKADPFSYCAGRYQC